MIATDIKSRPILFTPQMAQAVWENRKTQTRRLVKGVSADSRHDAVQTCNGVPVKFGFITPDGNMADIECPYGKPGDRLWVREAVTIVDYSERGDGRPENHWRAEVTYQNGNRGYWDVHMDQWRLSYEKGKRTPNIHMPRWACRSVLEVVSVRAERVEDITEADAIAEGFKSRADFLNTFYGINKRAPKGSNPWCWPIDFKRLEGVTA